ncbi:MAG: nicotinamide riboside transporter PnuC [Actinobacteria bacterium]|nr:nicotinamide riboside transporter PnuC [Actinomycetota bacterium]
MSILKWLFEAQIQIGSKSIAWREVIGGILGLSSAVLGMRRKVIAWPVGIFGDALLFTVFLGAVFSFGADDQAKNFYGQAGRNLLLIVVSLYGWVRWSQHRKSGAGDKPPVTPRWTTIKEKQILIPAVVIFYFASMQLFKALGESGTWLLVDTWIFTGTALATYGMSRGYVEFWMVWVAVDLVGVPFAFKNGYYPTGTLYAIYLPFVIWGFISWLKISKVEKESVNS